MTDLSALTPDALRGMSAEAFARAGSAFLEQRADVIRENQIIYYVPASETAVRFHLSKARLIGVGGGNRSSKTTTCLVEIIALATGIFPAEPTLAAVFREKFRGPLNVRICVESLTTHMHPVVLPKLKWWVWTGIDQQGGERGHWGWVPRMCLKGGSWDKAWSEKLRILTVLCRDPDDPERVLGESQIQFMSYDMDAADFASGTFHIVHMDEPPPWAVWRENQARVLDVNGRIFLSMTWPDDPSIAVDWIYDEVYERGLPGPLKDPHTEWMEFQTLDNVHLDAKAILEQTAGWSEESKKVKLHGQPLRFSNRIHPLFTDTPQTWCFTCSRNCAPLTAKGPCGCERASSDLVEYVHVEEFDLGAGWPVAFLLDPHPRKPHVLAWVGVDPSDDLWMVQEGQIEGDASDVKIFVDEIEEAMGLDVRLRLMDPNMGASPTARREVTWQDEFDNAGLRIDLADRSEVGRKRVNQFLKPDPRTRRPRLVHHRRCLVASTQMKRFAWDEHRRSNDRDVKQSPKPKYDDFPALWRYLLNYEPTFRALYEGSPVLTRPGKRRGAY